MRLVTLAEVAVTATMLAAACALLLTTASAVRGQSAPRQAAVEAGVGAPETVVVVEPERRRLGGGRR